MAISADPFLQENEVHCSNCQAVIGTYIKVEDQTWIRIGEVELKAAHGRCKCCRTEYHFSASQKLLEDLLARRQLTIR